ncbi:nucleotidyltransferase family protein [Candidatus Nitronereus thalassa]|uniref:Nucleotidyltransferase family protein n=1 Tax=Candidatus Nitronereus thalassa TaxID=3020898 RepID=A0ABU3K5N9_9BACT|nr:nucleotidyltransferase family protein [Candidatus Nitronereus thalassa]MDT7041677.1 nucleotidyltransferase family protein [Candidatus Nitronereus thalassa]
MAGGLGTRLQSVLVGKPKVLAEVKGRPFLSYLLDEIHDADYRRVVLCVGYKAQQVRQKFGENYKSLELNYSQESSPLGTGGALRLASSLVNSKRVLVLNGDSFCQVNLCAFEKWHVAKKSQVSIVLTHVPNVKRFGRVQISKDEMVLAFEEKTNESTPGLINAGVYLVNKSLITTIPEHKPISLEKDIFPKWIQRGICGYEAGGKFIDIGTPESFVSAEEFFGNCSSENKGKL